MSKNARPGWVMIRVRPETKAGLDRVKASLQSAGELGHTNVPHGRWDEITMDGVISVLLDRDQRHRDRKRNAARKKSRKSQEANDVGS